MVTAETRRTSLMQARESVGESGANGGNANQTNPDEKIKAGNKERKSLKQIRTGSKGVREK